MTKLPKDFSVTEDHRTYCQAKWGYPHMADVMLTDFVECFEKNGRKHKDWDLTFKGYIRGNSPEGRFYDAGWWDRLCVRAKAMGGAERKRKTPDYDPRGQQPSKPAEKQVVEAAMSKLRALLT